MVCVTLIVRHSVGTTSGPDFHESGPDRFWLKLDLLVNHQLCLDLL